MNTETLSPIRPETFPAPLREHRRQGARRRPPGRGRRPDLLHHAARAPPGQAGRHRPPAAQRQRHLLQRQPAHQPDERLRLHLQLQVLQLRGAEGRAPRLGDEPRARSTRTPPTRAATRSPSSTSSAACTRTSRSTWYEEMLRGLKRALPQRPPQGLHRHRDRLVRQAREAVDRGGAAPAARRRPGLAPRRRRRDLPPRGARDHLRRQARRRRVDRGPPHRPRMGIKSNCTMLYGHVEQAGAQGRPPAAPARPPGRDRRLQRLHPARLPPREQLHGAEVPHHRASTTCATSPPRRLVLDNIPHIKAYWVMLDPQARPGRAALRRRRHGRHGRRGEDLPHGRRRHPAAAHRAGARAASCARRASCRSSATRCTTRSRRPPRRSPRPPPH